ncbi:polysaccharide export protein [Paraglaciecola aquimarina]|uniref:Polysaccharide export protein n=1 Tax=Paraglaciecola algarum TaxID=3050085 RepID=A0ABS9D518_9ALTE|nr:XrtA/PEP-CTERM system exopolysaccharide export protein [Paraglaciecola sp. G1-23]MCF2947764.1 polysaccharide export protein [Paraglaciecola sp. G1-23]
MKTNKIALSNLIFFIFLSTVGCSSNSSKLPSATTYTSNTTSVDNYEYLIGPGDSLSIFVWRNPDISGSFVVRPDGKVTTSLVEDLDVSGKTPTNLARQIEEELSKYINNPRVTVSVGGFRGPLSEQVRVIGEATNPSGINYTETMTLLDLMIQVGGLTEFAAGNNAKLVRMVNGVQKTYGLKIDDLIKEGDIKENVDMLPGDIVIIPEAWF